MASSPVALAALPRATAILAGAMCLFGVLPSLGGSLALQPGHVLLGNFRLWALWTTHFIEGNFISFLVGLAVVLVCGMQAEAFAAHGDLARKLLLTAAFALGLPGLLVGFGGLMGYMSSGEEGYLYRPLFGTGPLQMVAAVSAIQIAGDGPVSPSYAPWLSYSHLPAAVLGAAGLSQYLLGSSRCFWATAFAWLCAWVYLRFLYDYGGGAIGDGRDAFEFLATLPEPLRTPFRPIVKVVGSVALKLPFLQRATGDGLKALPLAARGGDPLALLRGLTVSGGGVVTSLFSGGAGAAGDVAGAAGSGLQASDPVAERRRARALAAVDRKLAELRTAVRPAGAGGGLMGPPGSPGGVALAGVGGGVALAVPAAPVAAPAAAAEAAPAAAAAETA